MWADDWWLEMNISSSGSEQKAVLNTLLHGRCDVMWYQNDIAELRVWNSNTQMLNEPYVTGPITELQQYKRTSTNILQGWHLDL